jgi:hypothetical protein
VLPKILPWLLRRDSPRFIPRWIRTSGDGSRIHPGLQPPMRPDHQTIAHTSSYSCRLMYELVKKPIDFGHASNGKWSGFRIGRV